MKKLLKFITIVLILVGGWYSWQHFHERRVNSDIIVENGTVAGDSVSLKAGEEGEWCQAEIADGSTYAETMTAAGVDYGTAMAIYEAAVDVYDLATVRAGKAMELFFDASDELQELVYKIDSEEEINVKRKKHEAEEEGDNLIRQAQAKETDEWEVERRDIPYEIKIKTAKGQLESSVYVDALAAGIDERAIIAYAHAFQWSIDFAYDPRVGDSFEFLYEERYLNGEYVMPGKILTGMYNNEGKEYWVYYFEESEKNQGYFDADGNSVQKMFLKAPVDFKYISSGFTTGLRYISAFDVSTGHRAIDYAAAVGTPIRTTADGTVTFAGWSTAGYGNFVSIRHNGTYSTNYAHMSKIAVKKGQKVKQGEAIGYVGSTGFSTGPHLHYEMVKNGVKINPLKEVLPPGEPIKEENRERFNAELAKYREMMGN